jgi:hypothetical protein
LRGISHVVAGLLPQERRFLRRALERRLALDSATRRRIGQPLALRADERTIGAFEVVDPERDPVVVPEVELGGVAVQMGLGDMEIAAVDPALEDREVIFGSIGVPEIGADVLLSAVVHCAVACKLPTDRPVDGAFVGHQIAGSIDIRGHDWSEGLRSYVRDVETAHPTIALDQRQNSCLWRDLAFAVRSLSADESFVAFNDLICAAERTRGRDTKFSHGLADAMPEEPRGFQTALKGALKLAGADPLFRGTEQIDRLEPNPHGNVAGLEYRADLDGEWLAASVTLAETDAIGLAPQPPNLLAGRSAVGTNGTVRPEPRFDVFVSSFFAMELRGGKVGLHDLSP